MKDHLYVRRLNANDVDGLSKLFALMRKDVHVKRFHPHPFNREFAEKIAQYQGRDVYLGAFDDEGIVGYGMLRGWDAGFEIPSLGIYLSAQARGTGLASLMMSELHRHAWEVGAKRIRLKVYPENSRAIALYERMGYVFTGEEEGQIVGYLDLVKRGSPE